MVQRPSFSTDAKPSWQFVFTYLKIRAFIVNYVFRILAVFKMAILVFFDAADELFWSDGGDGRHIKTRWKNDFVILPRTNNNFRVNDPVQGEKRIHFRFIFPSSFSRANSEEVKAQLPNGIVCYFHGLGGHVNLAGSHAALQRIADNSGCVIIQVDNLGHGYSEGLRALITSAETPVHHHLELLNAVLTGENSDRLECDEPLLKKLRDRWAMPDCPLQFMGASFGGCFSIIAALAMLGHGFFPGTRPLREWPKLSKRFRGVITLAPFCDADMPHPVVSTLLRYLVQPLIPYWRIPLAFERTNRDSGSESEYSRALDADAWLQGGISWGQGTRFKTAAICLDVVQTFQDHETMKRIKAPILVLMDPEDQVVKFSGAQRLKALLKNVELIEIEGGSHDLYNGHPDVVVMHSVRWLNALQPIDFIVEGGNSFKHAVDH